VKVINVTKDNYEFQHDATIYTMPPGVPFDWPDPVARHAIRRSQILSNEGETIGMRVVPVGSLDAKKIRELARYRCPLADTGECSEGPFKGLAEMKAHFETHLSQRGETEDLLAAGKKR
jgi:hypothetical protein